MARTFPEDELILVGREGLDYGNLSDKPNVRFVKVARTHEGEVARLRSGMFGLQQIVRSTRPDVVWSLNLGPYLPVSVPCVLSVHYPVLVYGREETRLHPKNAFSVAALRWFFRRSLACADGVLVQTELMADCVRRLKQAPQRIEIVPKAVESEEVVEARPLTEAMMAVLRCGPLSTAFTFLYVSTAIPYKNHKVLAAALQVLASRRIKARLIVTLDADQVTKLYGGAAAKLVKEGYLVPVGWVQKEYLRSFYDLSDACLMPSLIESLSSSHLEAMCWGKPQICADLAYARDLCEDAAFYVCPKTGEAWAKAIELLMQDAELRRKLVVAGRARMKEFPPSWRDVAVRVRAFLHDISALNK
jgi:glycosyltransferase involved in cell wall biosynthesis